MIQTSHNERAVSPVVGVMLMLVVTIIIAALVSAFSGNLMKGDNSVPQASITGAYSQSKGLTMTHEGGDSLSIKDLQVFVRKSNDFGGGQAELSSKQLNFSTISTGTTINGERTYWRERFGTYGVVSWMPGESMYIINDGNANGDLVNSGLDIAGTSPIYQSFEQSGSGTSFNNISKLNNQYNIGKRLFLEVYTKDGKLISSTAILIQP